MKWMSMLQMYWPIHVLSPPNPIPLSNPVTIILLGTGFFMLCGTTSCYYNFVTCYGIPILMVLTSVEWFFGNLGNNWWFSFRFYERSPNLNLSLFKYLNLNLTLGPALILDTCSQNWMIVDSTNLMVLCYDCLFSKISRFWFFFKVLGFANFCSISHFIAPLDGELFSFAW
jgi:hypothetical protein